MPVDNSSELSREELIEELKEDSSRTKVKKNRYLQALKRAGRRITEQRQIVCAYLAQTESHPTPYQVFAELSAQYPEISRATVYNTLNMLQELGVIVEIALGTEHTHYETNTDPHVNLICLRCHEIIDYHDPIAIEEIVQEVALNMSFQPVAAKIDVLGFCARCRAQKKAEIKAQWLAQQSPSMEGEAR